MIISYFVSFVNMINSQISFKHENDWIDLFSEIVVFAYICVLYFL